MKEVESYVYEKGPTVVPKPCPGLYCGRTYSDGKYSACGACPWGSRVNASFVCNPCNSELPIYDWLYILTIVLATLLLHFYFIDKSVKLLYRRKPQVMLLHVAAAVECAVSAVVSVYLFSPAGDLTLKGCGVKRKSDFYTVFKNPQPNYDEKLYCAQEAVYPLYTIILCYLGVSVVFLLLLRTLLVRLLKEGKSAVYTGLYCLPIVAAFHGIFAGFIYFSYPALVLLGAIVSTAWFLASQPFQSPKELLLHLILSPRRVVILICHWLVTGFGVISVFQGLSLGTLALVPSPVIFYVMTLKFSDPSKLHND